MHFIYIIYSPNYDKFYIGETLDISLRLEKHNTKFYDKSSTSFTDDWELKLVVKVINRIEARKVEQYIKSMKSKKFINSLISDEHYLRNFKEIVLKSLDIKLLD